MIYYKTFHSIEELNDWYCGVRQYINIINIETLPPNTTFKFKVWYKE